MTALNIGKLTKDYFDALTNKTQQRPKYIILFSGVPGSGKSHIAKAIAKDLKAIRISNDDIRDWIVAVQPNIDPAKREKFKLQIATKLLDHLKSAHNGLVVFDVSCDRPGGYEFYANWAERHGYKVLLLRIDVPRELIEQRIRARGNEGYRTVDRSLALLDTWWGQWEAFGKRLSPDMTITPDTKLDAIIEKIRQIAKLDF
jgi:predicted kinase